MSPVSGRREEAQGEELDANDQQVATRIHGARDGTRASLSPPTWFQLLALCNGPPMLRLEG